MRGGKPRIPKQKGSRSLPTPKASASSTKPGPLGRGRNRTPAPRAPVKPPKKTGFQKVLGAASRGLKGVGATVRKGLGTAGKSLVSQASKLRAKISAKFKTTKPELKAFEKSGKEQAALVTKLKAAQSSKSVKMTPAEMKTLSDDLKKRGVGPEDRKKILGGVTVAETFKPPNRFTASGIKTRKAAERLDKDAKDLDKQIKGEKDPAKKAELKKQKAELEKISKKIKSGEPLTDKEVETYRKQRSKKGKTTGEIDDELSTVPTKTRRAASGPSTGGPSRPRNDDKNGPSKPKDDKNGPSKPRTSGADNDGPSATRRPSGPDDDKNLPSGVKRNASGVLRNEKGNEVRRNASGVVRDRDGNPMPGQTVQTPQGPVIVPQGSSAGVGLLGASILASSLPGTPGGAVVPGSIPGFPPANYNPGIPTIPGSLPPPPPLGNGPSPQPAPAGKTWAILGSPPEYRLVSTTDATGLPSAPPISGPSMPSLLSGVNAQLAALATRLGVSAPVSSAPAIDKIRQLKGAGASAKDLKEVGYDADLLKTAGFTALQLYAAGFTALDLRAAGFTAEELRAAGYLPTDLQRAGFPAADVEAAMAAAAGLGAASAVGAAAFTAAGFQPGSTTFGTPPSPFGTYDPATNARTDRNIPTYVQASLQRGDYDYACTEAPYATACKQLLAPPRLPAGGVPASIWNF